MTDAQTSTRSNRRMGVDRAQLRASLKRTPRERFERAVAFQRLVQPFRTAVRRSAAPRSPV